MYRSLILAHAVVQLRCRGGYTISSAVIRDGDAFALLVQTPDGLELVFRHALVSIIPQR